MIWKRFSALYYSLYNPYLLFPTKEVCDLALVCLPIKLRFCDWNEPSYQHKAVSFAIELGVKKVTGVLLDTFCDKVL